MKFTTLAKARWGDTTSHTWEMIGAAWDVSSLAQSIFDTTMSLILMQTTLSQQEVEV